MIKQALLSSAALVLASTVAFAGTAHAPKGMIVTKSLHGKPSAPASAGRFRQFE
jgi:hypothetical protein